MTVYREYALQVYDHNQGSWVPLAAYPASNKPHYYDTLRKGFEQLVRLAKRSAPPHLLGYRITCNGHPVDTWTNEKGVDGAALTVVELVGLLRPKTLAQMIAQMRDEAMIATPENRARITATLEIVERELGYRVDEEEADRLVAWARFPTVRALRPEDCP